MSGKVHETAKKGTIDVDKVETPNGARLGIRKYIDGKIYLHYKAAGTEDLLTPEQVVECILPLLNRIEDWIPLTGKSSP